ncbi:MAG: DEAD/DEAH box helicase, partial [Candidatus Bathyarchaeota archaeon]|nr:DEAD/DEAH box helicase [Candidatus Bathyarchaeota archaeon]
MEDNKTAFSLLVKPVQRLISERGFTGPTDPQKEAIPPILEGNNVLLIAPTGTGKTEAAILPIFSKFIELAEKPPGIKILYITPLRALNRDLLERLEWWCSGLDVKIAVRHGDTDVKERGRQAKNPPDLLITTPETLQAILPGRIMRRHLESVLYVILDEVHEFSENKRGSQLSIALERLRSFTSKDPQLVGLSATIGSPERVANFLVGVGRPFKVVSVPVARYMDLKIVYPEPVHEDYELAKILYTHPEVAARLRVMRKLIEGHKSVLLFTNTRAIAEVLASRFKVWDIDFPVSIHHGSLARPARITAERGLKNGELKGLVCTSSLELGLDVGRVDLCIQYVSPRQVTRIVQRVGRSGHRVGRVAKGVIVTLDSEDTLEAMVIARRAYEEDLEPVDIPEKPFDALTHQITGLLIRERRLPFQRILEIVRNAYPYRNLTEEDLVKVLTYMHTRYPRLVWVSFKDKLALSPRDRKGIYEYYYGNLSMIPYEKNYLVVDETDDTPVGILDEAFVSEYGEIGTKFIVRGSAWKIVNVYGDRIYVKPVEDPTGAIPSWVGEEIPVP